MRVSTLLFAILLLGCTYAQMAEGSWELYNQDGYEISVAYEHDFAGWEQASHPNADLKVHFYGTLDQKLNNGEVAMLVCFETADDFNVQDGDPAWIQEFGCLGLNNNCPYNTNMQSYFFASEAEVRGGNLEFDGSDTELSMPNIGAEEFDDSVYPDTRYAWTEDEFNQSNMHHTDETSYWRCYFKTNTPFNRDSFPRLDIAIDDSWGTQTTTINPSSRRQTEYKHTWKYALNSCTDLFTVKAVSKSSAALTRANARYS